MSFMEKPLPTTEIQHGPSMGPGEDSRTQSIRMLTIIVGTLTGLVTAGMGYLLIDYKDWQIVVLAGLYALVTGFCILAVAKLYPRKVYMPGLFGLDLLFGIAILGTASMLTGLGFAAALVFLIFTLILSSIALKEWHANLIIAGGILFAGLAALLNDYSPFQVTIGLVDILTPAILGILFMIYVVMLAMQFVTTTMRIRLVTAFLAIVIIPLSILSLFQSGFMFEALNDKITQSLELASRQTAAGIDNFLTEKQKTVFNAAQLEGLATYLSKPVDQRAGSAEEQEMKMTLRVLDTNEANSTVYLSSFALLDQYGVALYDTLRDRTYNRLSADVVQSMGLDIDTLMPGTGANESGESYFRVPMATGTPYISTVKIVSSTRGFFYISAPVKNRAGKAIGLIRARYDALLLQDLIKQYNGQLGTNSYAMLLDNYNIRLADGYMPQHLYRSVAPLSEDTTKTLKAAKRLPDLPTYMLSTDFVDFDKVLKNYLARSVFTTELGGNLTATHSEIGAITQVRSLPWKVVFMQTDYSDAALRRDQRRLTTLVTTLLAFFVGIIAVGGAQLLSSPIIRLTKTAQQISEGDLEARAPIQSTDEFGMLGSAFNLMTGQLRTLIAQLEDRVRARTQEIANQNDVLANRARQLQTVSEVARRIVSAQELETLLSTITHLVSERFGFYHVGIFLLDENKQSAVLRAANSDGGQRMLARHHALPVGRVGIVGYVTGMGEPRIATDVGEDAIYFNNPDLPNTRSEMALPLKVGGEIIGALDIQSTESNAFQAEDMELFATLADQVAIAIYNNRLYTETARALEESQNLHRQYLRSEWADDTAHRRVLGYLFNQSGIAAQKTENPLWKKVFASGEAVYANLPSSNGSPDKAVMAVPIAVRGETIGVIHVQDQGDERLWSEDEVAVVNSIANQVAVALENARLFENTVRRAEREKKVLQITAKIRSTNDPEEMMQIAVQELQEALHATRTQIYVRQEGTVSDQGTSSGNGKSSEMSSNL